MSDFADFSPLPSGKGTAPAGQEREKTFADFGAPTAESLASENRRQLFTDFMGPKESLRPGTFGKNVVKEAASLVDLVYNVFPGMVGIGADLGMRAREYGGGNSRENRGVTLTPEAQARVAAGETGGKYISPVDRVSAVGLAANQAVMSALGDPLKKLLALGGIGEAEGKSGTDAAMERVSAWLEKGAEATERITGGVVNKGEAQSIINTVMNAAGARGMAAGLRKVSPSEKALEDLRRSPEQMQRMQDERLRTQEPQAAAQAAEANAGEAVRATAAMGKPDFYVSPGGAVTRELPKTFEDFKAEQAGKPPLLEGPKVDPTTASAMRKVADGRLFDLTAEERIAYKAWKTLPEERPSVREDGAPMTPGQAALAAGVAGVVASQMDWEAQDAAVLATAPFLSRRGQRGGGLTLEEFKALSPALALGSLLDRSDYTLKTLDRLGQNKTEFPKAHIEQELRRQDVSAPEKAAVQAALDKVPGDKISARDLMVGVKEATGDFELKAKQSEEWSDYGLRNIDRGEAENLFHEGNGEPPPSRTTLYRSPLELSKDNHFDDPNLFGWTRSFDEHGVRHVVEIQSDLAQHTKTLGTEERAGVLKNISDLEAEYKEAKAAFDTEESQKLLHGYANESLLLKDTPLQSWLEALPKNVKDSIVDVIRLQGAGYYGGGASVPEWAILRDRVKVQDIVWAADTILRDNQVTRSELKAQLTSGESLKKISPMVKNWPKRLIREELAQVAETFPDAHVFEGQLESMRARVKAIEDKYGEGAVHVPDYSYIKGEIFRTQNALANAKLRRVRFATADTVAKIEGWPRMRVTREQLQSSLEAQQEGVRRNERYLEQARASGDKSLIEDREIKLAAYRQRLLEIQYSLDQHSGRAFEEEGHQSIYDRYKKDIEKFLRQDLGGKDYTDVLGHTWIEVKIPERVVPKQMFGASTPEVLARLAAIGVGAWAARALSDDHSLADALVGGFVGAVASHATPKSVGAFYKKWAGPDTRIRIDHLGDTFERFLGHAKINAWALQSQVEKMVPKTKDRARVTAAVEAGNLQGLSTQEARAATLITQFKASLTSGVPPAIIKAANEAYLNTIWKWSRNDIDRVGQWLDANQRNGVVPTIADGKAQGFIPITEDMSAILGHYSNSVNRAIMNSWFKEALQNEVDPAGRPLAQPIDKAPASYVPITNPTFAGLKVHPDVAPSVRMLFDTSSPGAVMKILQGLSDTSKRVAVSFSLFHAKALTDAMIGGSSNPFKALTKVPGFVAGTDSFLKELLKGTASPLVKRAIDSGLAFSLERMGAGVEDAGQGFYQSMKALQGFLDKTVPGAGLPIKGLEALNHSVDTFMWARLHAGMKLHMFAEKYQGLMDNAARKGVNLAPEEAGRIAASYANDLFGGLNWRRLAEDAKSRWGRQLGHAMLNPAARRVNQILLFAPDWTISTTRAAIRAWGKPDFLRPTTQAGLHQQYLIRSALYYMVVGDAINYAYSGHHIWDNKDWTFVELDPKGYRKMQWSKHAMEPVHWITKPGQQALNKLGFIPKEAATQALGVEYLSAYGSSPPMKGRVAHALKSFTPIAVQQGMQGEDLSNALAGALGTPIYGKTAEQRAKEKEERRKLRAEKKRKEGKDGKR